MILIITDSIPTPSFKRSGIFGYDDFKFFAENEYDVKMIILFRITYERRFLFDLKNQVNLIRNQIKEIKGLIAKNPNIEFIHYFSLIKPFVFKEDLFLFKKSKFNNQPFDLIIVHSMLHTGLNISWIRKQFPVSKIVLKEHSNWLLYPELVKYFAMKYINKFDKILANSESSKQSFQKIFTDYKNHIKNPLPIIEIDYPKFSINTKKIIKTKSDCLQILTVANLLKEKGFEESFNILKVLEEAKVEWFWTIIGKGIFFNKIIQLASDFNLLQKILILPEIQKPYIFDYMKKSDIYLQLSYTETFGIAPIEAFSYYNKLIVSEHIISIKELGLATNKNILIIKDINNILSQKEYIINFIYEKEFEDDFDKILTELNTKINKVNIFKYILNF
jgi:glycosyltransferase involved in cell wall biosynthesis